MNKPNSYDETQVGGNYEPVVLGGHLMVIKKVEETKSKNGRQMVKVYFDFAKNDCQPSKFAKEFKDDVRPEKKWPHTATQYILTDDKDGNCSKSFKSFITAFEKSNNCECVWGEKFAGQFKDKKIGGVFGEVENEYNGKVTMRHELRWFCEYDKATDAAIPNPRYLENTSSSASATQSNDWVNVEESSDEELPF